MLNGIEEFRCQVATWLLKMRQFGNNGSSRASVWTGPILAVLLSWPGAVSLDACVAGVSCGVWCAPRVIGDGKGGVAETERSRNNKSLGAGSAS
jgi:hypothetical protein